ALGSFSNQSLWRKTPVHGGPPGALEQLTPAPAGRTPLRTAIIWPCYPVPWFWLVVPPGSSFKAGPLKTW
ncbi:hypothetical protein STEG23_005241, partial [Scotinomys teguina]